MSTKLEHQLQKIREEAVAKVQDVADAYRRDVLIPLCRRRRLEFLSGNGSWGFYRLSDGSVLENWSPSVKRYDEVLSTECLGSDQLGWYMQDVREADL